MRIHQFHSGSAYGDAVTNSMRVLQRHLRALGFESEIFVEHLDPLLSDSLRPYDTIGNSLAPDDLLIIHHSMGHDRMEWLLGLECRKILMYHNITPAEFFQEDSVMARYSALGRDQLLPLKLAVEKTFAVSRFNARELEEIGFSDVGVLPVLVDDELYERILRPRCLESGLGRPWTVLFVGRVCENKGHLDLIDAAEHWKRKYPMRTVQFVCVGSYDPADPFFMQLRDKIDRLGLDEMFCFMGKLPNEALLDWYARADCYLSLSRHEGFGVPLIEAMMCELPVVALARSAVPDTLGGAGILIEEPAPEIVCRTLLRLMRNRPVRRQLLKMQRRRAECFRTPAIRELVADSLGILGIATMAAPAVAEPDAPRRSAALRIEGPCDTSYSLALVNRQLATALAADGSPTSLFCTEGPGDYRPDPAQWALLPREIRDLSADDGEDLPAVCVRNLYPPRVRDARGLLNAGYFFWEESSFPSQYVQDFNLSLDVMLAPSQFVARVWRASGVNVPIRLIGTGADHVLAVEPEPLGFELPPGKLFLHVSSCFPRKAPDVLLRAWGRAFGGRRDVCLVIKTFPNAHNRVPEMLEELTRRTPAYPPVLLLMEDYSPGRLRALYEACHAYVAPSRGEGFGLPMAEAMLHRLPVITTGWGGHTDFCRDDTAYLLRYRLVRSTSHVAGDDDSLWAEPDEDHLVEQLMRVDAGSGGDPDNVVDAAFALIQNEFTWTRVAHRLGHATQDASAVKRDFSRTPLRLGWVTTWNEHCGIATYSKYLLDHLDRHEANVTVYGRHGTSQAGAGFQMVPSWKDATEADLDALKERILRDSVEAVVVQFNFGFFNVRALAALVAELEERGIRVILVMHSTRDVDKPDFKATLQDGVDGFARAAAILVHSEDDLNRLIDFGLGENSILFPHGAMQVEIESMQEIRSQLGIPADAKIVSSYGFMLPHKGLPELIDAFAQLCGERDDVYLFMVNSLYPAEVSRQLRDELAEKIRRLGIRSKVRVFTDFLPENVGLRLLAATDLVVFPYQETAESASGALRFGLAAHRPVACTPLPIFSDLGQQGLRFRGCRAEDIHAGLASWLDRDDLGAVVQGQDAWLSARSWPKLMRRLQDMSRGLVIDARDDGRSFAA